MDIEEIVREGIRAVTCPYFSLRDALPNADLVIMPYQSLLNQETRRQIGVDIENTVVVFDEAHNVFEAVNQMHEWSICYSGPNSLQEVLKWLKMYFERYADGSGGRKGLADSTQIVILDLLIFTNSLLNYMKESTASEEFKNGIAVKNSELILELGNLWDDSKKEVHKHLKKLTRSVPVKNLLNFESTENSASFLPNITRWVEFFEKNDSIKKITGFYRSTQEKEMKEKKISQTASRSLLYTFKDLLIKFMQLDEDLTFCIQNSSSKSGLNSVEIRSINLNPYRPFKDLLKSWRDIIFASGTLKPLDDFYVLQESMKSDNASSSKAVPALHKITCDHIVSKEQIELMNVSKYITRDGKRNKFNFQFKNRQNKGQNLSLCHYLSTLPSWLSPSSYSQGIVIFFPSYAFLSSFLSSIAESEEFKALEENSTIFKETAGEDSTFKHYQERVLGKREQTECVILMWVAGGRLSEGINFSDDLARIIVVVGLPYPNRQSVDLRERIKVSENGEEIWMC
jgi:chromosome transmission fidelity protein 1